MCMKLLSVLCALTAQDITGTATVHDGDTIYVNHQAIRLYGVDAEELSEPNGLRAKEGLRGLLGSSVVVCKPVGDSRSHGRIVARCYIDERTDVNREVIARGLALDCAAYSKGEYRKVEPSDARSRLMQKPYC